MESNLEMHVSLEKKKVLQILFCLNIYLILKIFELKLSCTLYEGFQPNALSNVLLLSVSNFVGSVNFQNLI